MTSQLGIRCMMVVGMALLAGNAASQRAPDKDKTQKQVPAIKTEDQAAATKNAPREEPKFQSRKDKLSYAIGADFGRGLRSRRINVNADLLVKAMRDALAGEKLLMTDDEVTATLKRLQEERQQDYEHGKMMLSEKNKKAGEAFFAENLKKDAVVTLPSGLQYKILKQGQGKKPALDDKVVCHYRGRLLDGTDFDSSYKRNQPATLPVKSLIKGWSEALQLMPVGSKWELYIPSQLAYGERIVGGIAPNAMLIFEVELISIEDKAPAQAAQKNP